MSELSIVALDRIAFSFAPREWPFAQARRAEIAAHFAARQAQTYASRGRFSDATAMAELGSWPGAAWFTGGAPAEGGQQDRVLSVSLGSDVDAGLQKLAQVVKNAVAKVAR